MTIFTYTAPHPLVTDLAARKHLCTIQLHPSSRLLVDNLKWLGWRRVSSLGGGGGGVYSTWFHTGLAERRSTVHQLPLYDTLYTTIHLMGRMWLTVHLISVGNTAHKTQLLSKISSLLISTYSQNSTSTEISGLSRFSKHTKANQRFIKAYPQNSNQRFIKTYTHNSAAMESAVH
jgi:hypothetical protein